MFGIGEYKVYFMKSNFVVKVEMALLLFFIVLLAPTSLLAKQTSCFSSVEYVTPKPQKVKRELFVLVDETVPLTKGMKKRVIGLLSEWGKPGDMVKVARFSASYRDLYPELVFVQKVEMMPDEAFLFNLSYKDKKIVLACLKNQEKMFKEMFHSQLTTSLKALNPKIPKSELLGSLKLLSKQVYLKGESADKTVFLITDGMENSAITSFYGKGKLRKINPRKEISTVRRKGMIGYWKKANVFIYGLGLMPDDKSYAKPEQIEKLKRFWEQYFVESGGKIKAIGAPELLLTSVE